MPSAWGELAYYRLMERKGVLRQVRDLEGLNAHLETVGEGLFLLSTGFRSDHGGSRRHRRQRTGERMVG